MTDIRRCYGCFQAERSDQACDRCGYLHDPEAFPTALPPGTVLARYTIGRVLGKPGGFGITYLGYDAVLERRVAIKELMPRELVARKPDRETLQVQTREDVAVFEYTLRSFLNEARLIAQLNHPNLVRVLDYFDANGTAYFAMEYYEGRTLQEYVATQGGRLSGPEAVSIILPILDALEEIHSRDQPVLHRDIKPANIYLAKKTPILLDFGAARLTLGEQSRSLSAVLTPGFAPYEQYSSRGNQGPWTDVYGCAATLHFLVTGRPPPDASMRVEDPRIDDPRLLAPDISPALAAAIISGLGFRPAERPQSAREFSQLVQGRGAPPVSISAVVGTILPDAPTVVAGASMAPTDRHPLLTDDAAPAGAHASGGVAPTQLAEPPGASRPAAGVAAPAYGNGWKKWSVAAAIVLVLGGSVAFAMSRIDSAAPPVIVDGSDAVAPGPDPRTASDELNALQRVAADTGMPSVEPATDPAPSPATPGAAGVRDAATAAAAVPQAPPPASTATPASASVPVQAATGILVIVYGDDARDAQQAETAVLRSLSGRDDYRPLNASTLALIRGDQSAVNQAIGAGDFAALARLGREHGAEFLVVGDLSSRASPSFGQFFSGTAELDLKMYRVSSGSLVDAQVFRVGSGGNQAPSALNQDQARSQAAEQAGTLAANAARLWLNRVLR